MSRVYLTERGPIAASRFTLRTNEFELNDFYPCTFCGGQVATACRAAGEVNLTYEDLDGTFGLVCDECGAKFAPELQARRASSRKADS